MAGYYARVIEESSWVAKFGEFETFIMIFADAQALTDNAVILEKFERMF